MPLIINIKSFISFYRCFYHNDPEAWTSDWLPNSQSECTGTTLYWLGEGTELTSTLFSFRLGCCTSFLSYIPFILVCANVQAKRMLKNLRVKASHRNMEFKIIGLSEKPCNQQLYVIVARNNLEGKFLLPFVLERFWPSILLLS